MKVPRKLPTVKDGITELMRCVKPAIAARNAFYASAGMEKTVAFTEGHVQMAIMALNLQKEEVVAQEFIVRTYESWPTIHKRDIIHLLKNIEYFFQNVNDEDGQEKGLVFKQKLIDRVRNFFLETSTFVNPETGQQEVRYLTDFQPFFVAMDNLIRTGLLHIFYARNPYRRPDGKIAFRYELDEKGQQVIAFPLVNNLEYLASPAMFNIFNIIERFDTFGDTS